MIGMRFPVPVEMGLFDAFSKTQNDASSLIDEFKRRCEERSASRDG